jgi:hypothetical protein
MCCHLNHSCDCDDVAAQPCIAALIAERRFPVRCADWDALQSYLRDRNACDQATRAGRRLWREYEKQRRASVPSAGSFLRTKKGFLS